MHTTNKVINECLERMRLLKLDNLCATMFEQGKIYQSELCGALCELTNDELDIVKEFETQHPTCKVYHVIHNVFEFGNCYTLLYVDSEEEDYWQEEKDEIIDGYVFTYVKNVDCDWCSEFGSVYVESSCGGLIRLS